MPSTSTLGWQSWSPPTPRFLHIPPRDYPPNQRYNLPLPSQSHTTQVSLTYWCSWYALGYFPNPQSILKEAETIYQYNLPITHILIDDGWKMEWIESLSQHLHNLSFKVGLWYAPFTRHQHLDTLPTLDRLINSCHLDLLKLDFLYYPYFHPRKYPNPDNSLLSIYHHLKNNYPNLTTIGCGAPFHSTIGQVDIIRLGKDTAMPYPIPKLFNSIFYSHRLNLLFHKYRVWTKDQLFTPDPDVRMFSLDTPQTDQIWSKMSYSVKGVGDRISALNNQQLEKMSIWLQK